MGSSQIYPDGIQLYVATNDLELNDFDDPYESSLSMRWNTDTKKSGRKLPVRLGVDFGSMKGDLC
jgi:hypothetical protein